MQYTAYTVGVGCKTRPIGWAREEQGAEPPSQSEGRNQTFQKEEANHQENDPHASAHGKKKLFSKQVLSKV